MADELGARGQTELRMHARAVRLDRVVRAFVEPSLVDDMTTFDHPREMRHIRTYGEVDCRHLADVVRKSRMQRAIYRERNLQSE